MRISTDKYLVKYPIRIHISTLFCYIHQINKVIFRCLLRNATFKNIAFIFRLDLKEKNTKTNIKS